jgi:hypothetical protein
MNFLWGFVAGSFFQATAGTLIAMNIDAAWPWVSRLLVQW